LLLLLEFQLYHCSLFPRTSRLLCLEDGGNDGGDEEDEKDLNNMHEFINRKDAREGVFLLFHISRQTTRLKGSRIPQNSRVGCSIFKGRY
jgi:hypothetical protein